MTGKLYLIILLTTKLWFWRAQAEFEEDDDGQHGLEQQQIEREVDRLLWLHRRRRYTRANTKISLHMTDQSVEISKVKLWKKVTLNENERIKVETKMCNGKKTL